MRKALSLLLCLMPVILLAGCAKKDAVTTPEEPSAIETTAAATETFQTDPMIPETIVESDVSARLKEAEEKYTALQDRLMNDGSLTQADMNELAGQQYTLWDTLLNDLWAELTHTLPEEQMQQLLQEERAWIHWKENSIALAADYYSGGSLSILSANMRAATLTRDRVYELAQILTSRQYPTPHSENWLYHQVFLPYIANGEASYENLLHLLDFRGLSYKEEEGIIQIQDPQCPEVWISGSLSNESDVVTVPQLLYCFGSREVQQGVRVDFLTDPPAYYIGAVFWDDGTEVSSPEELTAYIQNATK